MGKEIIEVEVNKDNPTKSWFVVFNNPQNHGYEGTPEDICERLKEEWVSDSDTRSGAWIYCISAEGLRHIHMVLEDTKYMRFSLIKKSYAQGAHFVPTRGNKRQAEDYIYKRGKWEEKGEKILYTTVYGDIQGAQGKRNDLADLYQMIKDGYNNYQILESNPNFMKRLNTIDSVRETLRYEEFKNKYREMHVEYYSGVSGSGKSRSIMEQFGYENVYRITDYKNPWDCYKGQDVVLFEEFYSSNFLLPDMLNWLDGYPLDLPCRYNNKVACFTKVFLTSNLLLQNQYKYWQMENPESWKAFLRRINCIKVFNENGSIDSYQSLDESMKRFIKLPDNYKNPWDTD